MKYEVTNRGSNNVERGGKVFPAMSKSTVELDKAQLAHVKDCNTLHAVETKGTPK